MPQRHDLALEFANRAIYEGDHLLSLPRAFLVVFPAVAPTVPDAMPNPRPKSSHSRSAFCGIEFIQLVSNASGENLSRSFQDPLFEMGHNRGLHGLQVGESKELPRLGGGAIHVHAVNALHEKDRSRDIPLRGHFRANL